MGAARRAAIRSLKVRAWPIRELPRWLAAFVSVVVAAYLAASGAAFTATPIHAADLRVFAVLIACGAAAVELTRRAGEQDGFVRDVYAIWDLPTAVLLPPLYALLIPLPRLALTQWRVHRSHLHRRAFSMAAIGLAYGAASLVFRTDVQVLGRVGAGNGLHALVWTGLAASSGVICMIVNNSLVFAAVKGSDPSARLRSLVFSYDALYNDVAELSLGVLTAFTVAHSALAAVWTLPMVILLQRSIRHARLVDSSRMDSKTGLLNAGTWQREAALEITRAFRSRTPLAVAIADLDHFKAVNDTHGHLAGDQVLRAVADLVKAQMRAYDVAGRFGGEEFVVLLPHTRASQARQIAERIREQISQLAIPLDGPASVAPLRITISVGVAVADQTDRSLDELLAAADHALYQAKGSGRNRVVLCEDAVATHTSSPFPPACLEQSGSSASQQAA
jgi:diguanylate cyclase (GGDEF)-like protein